MTCFAATLCYGIYNGNESYSIISSAIIVALFALMIGSVVGSLMLRTVDEHIKRYKKQNPVPDENDAGPDADTDTDFAEAVAG